MALPSLDATGVYLVPQDCPGVGNTSYRYMAVTSNRREDDDCHPGFALVVLMVVEDGKRASSPLAALIGEAAVIPRTGGIGS